MRRLYECENRIEAQMLHDALASHHIQTVIMGDYLSGAAGELSALQFPVLWVVEDDDFRRGRELLEHYLQRPQSSNAGWRCENCGEEVEGEFDLCWNCSSPRP